MDNVRSIVKLVAAQALAVFIVFNVVVWTICLGFTVYNVVVATAGNSLRFLKTSDRKSRLPNYATIPWASTHFGEFASLKADYLSYIGWRRPLFKGETINVVGPFHQRATVGTADASEAVDLLLRRVDDVGDRRGRRQYDPVAGLADRRLPGGELRRVGLDRAPEPDAPHPAPAGRPPTRRGRVLRRGKRGPAQVPLGRPARSARAGGRAYRSALASTRARTSTACSTWSEPLVAVARVVAERIAAVDAQRDEHWSAALRLHTDPAKARRVADALMQDWEMARKLTEAHGGRFVGILQPVAHFSDTRKDHIRLADIQRKQYEAVYPLVRAAMAGRPGLHDLTGILDRDEHIYIDFCHVSPNGNRYVAQKIVEVLGSGRRAD